jgi:hypothetical protein
MPTTTLNLEAQAGNVNGSFSSTGSLFSANDVSFTGNPSSSAMRFPLPLDVPWNTSAVTINSAVLTIRGRVVELFPGATGDSNNRISILNSSSQVLPTTAAGVSSAVALSTQKTIGTNAYASSGYSLDYTLTTSFASVDIDIKTIFEAAQSAGILTSSSDKLVILLQPIAYTAYGGIEVDGLTQTAPCSIALDYTIDDGDDIVDLDIIDISISVNGLKMFVEFNSPVTASATPTGSVGFSLSSNKGSVSLTYVDGYTEIVGGDNKYYYEFDLSRLIHSNETLGVSYADPPLLYGSIEWETPPLIGDPLAPFTNRVPTNNSTTRLVEPVNAETLSKGTEPKIQVVAVLSDVEASETLSEGNDASFLTLSGVYPAETLSEGDEPNVRLFSPISSVIDAETLSAGNQVTLDDYLVLPPPENSQTGSFGNSPRVRSAKRPNRSLIPNNLLPGKK